MSKKTTKQAIKEDLKTGLSAEEYTFSKLVAKGYSGTTAYRKAFPAKSKLSYNTIRTYSSELLTNPDIITEVQTSRVKQARLARLAEERIEQILITDDSMAKGSKVADVAMFMYDHANGKATQRIEQTGKFVTVNMNLTGNNEPVPPEVLEQLKEN